MLVDFINSFYINNFYNAAHYYYHCGIACDFQESEMIVIK